MTSDDVSVIRKSAFAFTTSTNGGRTYTTATEQTEEKWKQTSLPVAFDVKRTTCATHKKKQHLHV